MDIWIRSFQGNGVHSMMCCELAEQPMEGSPFLRMETREELLIVVIGNLRQFRNNAAPRTGQREQLTSIVYGVSPAPDPALRLEFVDDLGDRAAGHS